eukprot:493388-Pelagomonas_calceolata.AAC.2
MLSLNLELASKEGTKALHTGTCIWHHQTREPLRNAKNAGLDTISMTALKPNGNLVLVLPPKEPEL